MSITSFFAAKSTKTASNNNNKSPASTHKRQSSSKSLDDSSSPPKRRRIHKLIEQNNEKTTKLAPGKQTTLDHNDIDTDHNTANINDNDTQNNVKQADTDLIDDSLPSRENKENQSQSVNTSKNKADNNFMKSPISSKSNHEEEVDIAEGHLEHVELGEEEESELDEENVNETTSLLTSAIDDSKDANSAHAYGGSKYDVVTDAGWKSGSPVPYSALTGLFELVENESGRLRILAMSSDLFRSVIALSPRDLISVVYLCCNRLAPQYEGMELGIGEHILMKAINESTGVSMPKLKTMLKDLGDLGLIAMNSRTKQQTMFPPPPLTVQMVFKTFREIALANGKKSAERKKDLIKKLVVACRGTQAKFLIRALQGNLRIGLAERSVISALARAVVLTPPIIDSATTKSSSTKKTSQMKLTNENSKSGEVMKLIKDTRDVLSSSKLEKELSDCVHLIQQAYTEVPSHEKIISTILEYGVKELPNKCFLTPGIPVKVMLGKPVTSIQQIIEIFGNALFTLELKYDGERAQIHRLSDGSIKIYSRNSEDNTGKYPDLIQVIPNFVKCSTTSFIIDCEVVAFDRTTERILPFQTLSTRKRKDVKNDDITVQVCLFAFDILFFDGKSYLDQTLKTRRQILYDNFQTVHGQFQFAHYKDTAEIDEIQPFMDYAVQQSCEGLMVKGLVENANYVPNKRNWLKVKKDYLDTGGDSLDLVVIGAWYGKGKRTGGFGSFLLACYDSEKEEWQSICKLGTGFSEEQLIEFSTQLQDKVLTSKPAYVHIADTPAMTPDVFISPTVVWEVKCADLSISPVHTAAIGQLDSDKGIALRFPRFVRVRTDKTPDDASNTDFVIHMYEQQHVRR